MSIHHFPSDRLHRLMRQQQFRDHDARRWPTEQERRTQRVNVSRELSREAAQAKAQPKLVRL